MCPFLSSPGEPVSSEVDEYGEPDQVMETYTDSDINSSSYLKTLNVYNPLYDMILNSSNESRSFGFRNNFEIDWRVYDELRVKGRFSISKSSAKAEVFKSPKAILILSVPSLRRKELTRKRMKRT